MGSSFGSCILANWLSRNVGPARDLGVSFVLLFGYGHSATPTMGAAENALGGIASLKIIADWKRFLLNVNNDMGARNFPVMQRLAKEKGVRDLNAMRSARSISDWDSLAIKFYGLESLAAMLDRADPVCHFHKLVNLGAPIVLVNADDDWLCPSDRLRLAHSALYSRMSNVALVTTKGGGHLGWVDDAPMREAGEQPKRGASGAHCRWLVSFVGEVLDALLVNPKH